MGARVGPWHLKLPIKTIFAHEEWTSGSFAIILACFHE